MAPGAKLRQALTLWRISPRIAFGALGLVLLLLLAGWLLAWRAAGQLVDSLRWFGTPEYASVSVGPLGTVEYSRFRLLGRRAGEPEVFSAARVRLHTPGLHWLVWHGFVQGGPSSGGLAGFLGSERQAWVESNGGLPRAFPPAGRLALAVEGLVPGPGLAQAGDLRWIGLASGAPLDGEGCDGRSRFTAADLVEMGISDGPTRAEASIDVERADTARITFAVERLGASRSELDMTVRIDRARALLDADWSNVVILERRWSVRDQGLVSARNRWCAARLGISRDGFVDRHLAAIKREFAAIGATPTAELESAYRRYAARGGEITWHSRPSLTTPVGQLATFGLADRLRILNATLESVRGREAAFRFTMTTPVPQAVVAQPPDPAGAAPLPDDAAPVPPPSGVPDSAAPPVVAAEPVAPPVVAPVAPAVVAPAAAPAVATVAPPVTPARPAVAPAPGPTPPPARPSPATVPAPSLATRAPLPATGRDLAYADLAGLVGRRIEVRSTYGSIRRGTLEKFTDAAITVRLESRERGLSLTMPNQTVRSARLLDRGTGAAEPADG
jgi:hypothetical protein